MIEPNIRNLEIDKLCKSFLNREITLQQLVIKIGRLNSDCYFLHVASKRSINAWLRNFAGYNGQAMARVNLLYMPSPNFLKSALDHGYVNEENQLVGEPYQITKKDLIELIDFCNEKNLDFCIHGTSHHYPGHTLSIVFSPKGEEK
jgi:hypothetical protein